MGTLFLTVRDESHKYRKKEAENKFCSIGLQLEILVCSLSLQCGVCVCVCVCMLMYMCPAVPYSVPKISGVREFLIARSTLSKALHFSILFSIAKSQNSIEKCLMTRLWHRKSKMRLSHITVLGNKEVFKE